jgi:chemotaxis protein MotC
MKVRWPKLRLPKFGAPKWSLPKLAPPKISLPKVFWPKISPPKFALPRWTLNSRTLVIGASALALLGAGGFAWFFVRPMLSGRTKPAQETAEQAAGTPGRQASAESTPAPTGLETPLPPPQAKTEPQPAAGDGAAAPENPSGNVEKTAGAPPAAPLPPDAPPPPAAPAPLPPLAPPDEPEQLARRLQDIQEQVALGDATAFAEMPRLLRRMAQKFVEAPPEVWSRKHNARALIFYLLSGGGSATGRRILGEHTFAPSEEPLARGAIAYLENVEGSDRDYLLRLDPRALDLDLAAQVAFVQSILLSGVDRPAAMARLDLARLLAPGGLVEEAALRREVALLSETAEFDKFAGLARQYWQHYRASPYADNFLRQFMLAVIRVSQSIQLSEWAQLAEFIESLSPETRRELYLAMARTAAVVGNGGLAAMAARQALELSPVDSPDRQRALLYRAAARVGAADFTESRLLLRDLDRSKLPAGDQPLHDAVTLALTRIFRPPEQHFASAPPGAANDADAALARAERSVKRADAALDSVRRTMERKSR